MNIEHTIPERLRPFLTLTDLTIPKKYSPIADALAIAIKVIDAKVKIEKPYFIVLGTSPFKIPINTAPISQDNFFTLKTETDVICMNVMNIIFIDYLKLSKRSLQCTVAIILEEFVHALMNVKDENLVKHIVCLLYPDVGLNRGSMQYCDNE